MTNHVGYLIDFGHSEASATSQTFTVKMHLD